LELVQQWDSSGLSAEEFGVQHDAGASQLKVWKRRFARDDEGSLTGQGAVGLNVSRDRGSVDGGGVLGGNTFVEVGEFGSPDSRFEVSLRSGHRILVPSGFVTQDLGRLILALEGRA